MKCRIAVVAGLLCAGAALAGPFDTWNYRAKVTFGGYSRPETLTNFPVLLVLGTNIAGFSYDQFQSGLNADLRVTGSNRTEELNYEIDTWNTNGDSSIWVQVPRLASAGDSVWVYWGKSGLSAPAYTTNGAAWSNGYAAVWHMNEANARDSTSSRFHGVGSSVSLTSGVVGTGLYFNGSTANVLLTNAFSVTGSKFTLEVWGRTTNTVTDKRPFDSASGRLLIRWNYGSAGKTTYYDSADRPSAAGCGANLNNGAWQCVTYVLDQTAATGRVYQAGALIAESTFGTTALGGNTRFGCRNDATGQFFQGSLDEIRLTKGLRSADWVWASYQNALSNGAFQTYGPAVDLAQQPKVTTLAPTAITAVGATLNGELVSTGAAPTAVWAFWGESDLGETNEGWTGSATWDAPQATGSFAYAASLAADRNWYYRFAGSNAWAWTYGEARTFINGELTVQATDPSAKEEDGTPADPGTFTIVRPVSTTNWPATVSYTVGGTAASGVDYAALSGSATIPAGATNVDVTVNPISQAEVEGDETVTLTLSPGLYAVGAMNSATVTITDAASTAWYVRTNGSDSASGASWGDAFLTLTNAIAHADFADVVNVSNGVYTVGSQVLIEKGITVRSLAGAAATTVRRTGGSAEPRHRVFMVSNANATVEGLTVQGGFLGGGTNGAGVYLANGVVRDCVIQNCTASGSSTVGAGLYITNGVVTNCIIRNNSLEWGATGGGAYLNKAGLVVDCVISNQSTGGGGGNSAGAHCQQGGIVRRCRIVGNSAQNSTGYGGIRLYQGGLAEYCVISNNTVGGYIGGGAGLYQGGTLRNCLVANNVSTRTTDAGAGVYMIGGGSIENCTIVGNTASAGQGGGLYATGGAVTNTILYFNTASSGANFYTNGAVSFAYDCTTPAVPGPGNLTDDPQFVNAAVANYRLLSGSPCLNVGATLGWMSGAPDLDGSARVAGAGVDLGVYERADTLGCSYAGTPTRGLAPLLVAFTAATAGGSTNGLYYRWDYDNDGVFDEEGEDKKDVSRSFDPGFYTVRLVVTNAAGEVAEYSNVNYIAASPGVVYVSTNGSHTVPYTNWALAATNVPAAYALASDGAVILASNGTYQLTGQLTLDRAVTLRSVNGPAVTVLRRSTAGNYRVLKVTANATVDGIGIQNGYAYEDLAVDSYQGGGVYMTTGTLVNCRVNGNSADSGSSGGAGAGVYLNGGGVVSNCVLWGNSISWDAWGGGAYLNGGGLLVDCVVTNNGGGSGGGNGAGVVCNAGGVVRRCFIARNNADNGTGYGGLRLIAGGLAESCVISNNTTTGISGGAGLSAGATLRNCLVLYNLSTRAADAGAGVRLSGGSVENCTISANTASAGQGGGLYATGGALTNTILYGNSASSGANWYTNGNVGFAYSCTTPDAPGPGNTSADPQFAAAGNYRLLAGSPCLNVGTLLGWMAGATDLDGSNRVVGAAVDMGAYERLDAMGCSFVGTPTRGLAPLSVTLTATVVGGDTNGLTYGWDYDNDGSVDESGGDKQVVTHPFAVGIYTVRLRVQNASFETAEYSNLNYIASSPAVIYVATNGTQTLPYTNWATAATNLPPALALAADGALVRVSDGTYRLDAQLNVDVGATVRSESGSAATVLRRNVANVGDTPKFRVLKITHGNAVVDGFGIQNGYAYEDLAVDVYQGGGVYMTTGMLVNCRVSGCLSDNTGNAGGGAGVCLAGGGTVSNCVIAGNTVQWGAWGAGLSLLGGGLVVDSLITNNTGSVAGGNAGGANLYQGGVLRRCLVAGNRADNATGYGGAYASQGGLLENCVISNNTTTGVGGGAGLGADGAMRNCLVLLNRSSAAGNAGAGVHLNGGGSVENCTIVTNSATGGAGGVYGTGGALTNCIVYYNAAASNANWLTSGSAALAYTCTDPLAAGVGNITNEPLFSALAAGDYRLGSGSPCANAGANLGWMVGAVDLAGNMRRVGTVDMGAYERLTGRGAVFVIR
jgi:hypothetical protein